MCEDVRGICEGCQLRMKHRGALWYNSLRQRRRSGGRIMRPMVRWTTLLCLLIAGGCAWGPRAAKAPPAPVEITVASWNIEQFDAAGPDDRTFPTRTARHLEMIAETILRTGADVIGLQEIVGPEREGDPYALDQLVAEMNRLDAARGRPASWKGWPTKPPKHFSHIAMAWNDRTLELLGRVTSLWPLHSGYGKKGGASSKEDLRFPRIPLAARFRVRAAPENSFTMVVLHLKAGTTGLRGGLDTNDVRRRGEWEDLLRKWVLDPDAQGELCDRNLVIAGDMNEKASVIVSLMDEFGTGDDVKGRLVLDPSDFSDPAATLLFASGGLKAPRDYTYQGNSEKGEEDGGEKRTVDELWDRKKFMDQILISRSLADAWDGEYRIEYFEKAYPLSDHIHLSDHRPVCIRLRFPAGK